MQGAKDFVDGPEHEMVALGAFCDPDGLRDLQLFLFSHGFAILVDPKSGRIRLESIELGVIRRGKDAVL